MNNHEHKSMNRTISFNHASVEIIEKYMQDHACTFNKAVNEIINAYTDIDLHKYVKNTNRAVMRIYRHLIK